MGFGFTPHPGGLRSWDRRGFLVLRFGLGCCGLGFHGSLDFGLDLVDVDAVVACDEQEAGVLRLTVVLTPALKDNVFVHDQQLQDLLWRRARFDVLVQRLTWSDLAQAKQVAELAEAFGVGDAGVVQGNEAQHLVGRVAFAHQLRPGLDSSPRGFQQRGAPALLEFLHQLLFGGSGVIALAAFTVAVDRGRRLGMAARLEQGGDGGRWQRGDQVARLVRVIDQGGLHAGFFKRLAEQFAQGFVGRAVARIVQAQEAFDAAVAVWHEGLGLAPGDDGLAALMGLLQLGGGVGGFLGVVALGVGADVGTLDFGEQIGCGAGALGAFLAAAGGGHQQCVGDLEARRIQLQHQVLLQPAQKLAVRRHFTVVVL